ncbi:winged-helix domain-containing protein [Sinorhizobium meliloti]|uniref:winged helix-turn-helix transcriptional regulator n=1 Tax=Rhizobium meliloti TaxID=382 RepID=UPI001D115616|nr:response regulator transcription factor [Sinorhizobium meliloti]MDE4605501.1 response regulator transcription factor [Sinorhizobium meliloti]MDE4617930.1 response regulator transcription factor [Sinorhizobium meliloti]UDU22301.1 response regulator transcription factor [Sinorhizobium meliloti]WQP09666.1 response regulator transcription factor [Sinorhizobium meliloti]WQP23119.1 response regulator transcription factor [Sinorhizobium meliloti]
MESKGEVFESNAAPDPDWLDRCGLLSAARPYPRIRGISGHLGSGVEEIVHLAGENDVRAILLDCRSGEEWAPATCVKLKQQPRTFGITTVGLIGPGAESRFIDLLKAGIDENFVRPIAPSKLLGFLRDRILHGSHPTAIDGHILAYAGIELSTNRHSVKRFGVSIHLGPIEFRLLQLLMENREQACTRAQLIEAAWRERRFVDAKTVNVHIGRLRKALSVANCADVIRTVRSSG